MKLTNQYNTPMGVMRHEVGEIKGKTSHFRFYSLQLLWAERNRVWAWMHRHDPLTKKKYGFLEACRATLENPPCFDIGWDVEMENK